MITCCTCSGATSARSSAASIAVAPSSVASIADRPPPNLPIGVRAAPRITVFAMDREARSLPPRLPASSGQPIPNLRPPGLEPAATEDRKRQEREEQGRDGWEDEQQREPAVTRVDARAEMEGATRLGSAHEPG